MDYTELPILTRLAAYLNALAGNGEAPDPLVYNEYFLKGIVERLDGIGKGEKGDKGDKGDPGATIVSVEKLAHLDQRTFTPSRCRTEVNLSLV